MITAPQLADDLSSRVNAFVDAGHAFIDANPQEWRLDHDADLEVTNHVLRVRIQNGTVDRNPDEVLSVVRCQHDDGGWGDRRDDRESRLRSTAFCVQMLIRAQRVIHDARIDTSIARGLEFIVAAQTSDGSWRDHRWHLLDATSVSVGTLLFAVNEPRATSQLQDALKRGMSFVISQRRSDGLWYYRDTASPVTISAHLLQKCAVWGTRQHDLVLSANALLDRQHSAGHWDKENIDHTCDASRTLMLVAGVTKEPPLVARTHGAIRTALLWILDLVQSGGLGDRPGHRPHVERTCDGIDTVLKYQLFADAHESILRFWR